MRVLFASKQHFGVGGIEASTHQLALRMIRAGHRPAVLAGAFDDDVDVLHALGIRRRRGLGYEAWAAGSVPPGAAIRWVRRRLRPDVVVVNGGGRWYDDWTRGLLRGAEGVPTALYVRDTEALELLHGRVRRPELVLANAEAHAVHARELGYPTRTVPSLIEPDLYRTTTTDECVLYVNPAPVKGLHVALDLARARPDVPFLFQEAWPMAPSRRRWLEAQASVLGNVELQATTADAASFYRRARILLAPYFDLNRPRVIAEAQLSGLAALATDDPAMREAVGPGGILVPPEAPLSVWLEGLCRLWDDAGCRARYAEAAVRHSARPDMDADRVTAAFVEAIEELAARPARAVHPGEPRRDRADPVTGSVLDGSEIVSVVVPVRNGAATIDTQLGALAAQGFPDAWEVIVADNGSSDATAARAQRWAGRLPCLRVVDASGRASVAHARNVGVRHARGERVLVCDADDEVDEHWVEEMADALRQHDLVTGAMDRASLNTDDQYAWTGPPLSTEAEEAYGFLPFAAGGNLGLRRSLFDVVGGFDERLTRAEDIDLSWRAWYAGYRVAFVPTAVIRIAMRPTLRSLFRTRFKGGTNEVLLYRRHRTKGMTKDPWAAGTWRWLARSAPRLGSDRSIRYQWVATLGKRLGRLAGSVRHRCIFL